ncbi:MAG: excinuclease ABC subunit UvrB [Meiothermus sp.]|uniref:excinuclease ABC subunit UvrB n=1 Tax=Meiothermus sp. TaxID=1955249 RepID=UPI0025F47851|nr:excinuclease ABC subunit UvrB [Meiothermus sp.]MCS7058835.1 excinuclease ABC subunit UvrB [Meiothermus sp.]MCS7194065.1 excinuclease ABC subunit UvrB [Meiothermus sp.]MCX7740436.1 excinuclease ABC subunit UvrB [Meiothermus sp.]MDW8091160.1 excinuclease ABC subunit UvrB [Meiothermus sp.]MDW8480464.1 excinuclease ABC subunit UvrB [Meiothermus sp.]
MFRYQGPTPQGDQPQAIEALVEALRAGERFVTLLGATGTGKTVTMAKVIEHLQRPALVMAPNKVLAAQLSQEFRELFPENAVEYFISYYDYYQPEAYVPGRDLYIEKDASINPEIERLRHSTTRSLLTRRDVIVVASVSAIYGLGSPEEYRNMSLVVEVGRDYPREVLLARLVELQYERGDVELRAGRFRVRGEVVEVWPAYEQEPIRIELWGDTIDRITVVHPVTGERLRDLPGFVLLGATHYATPEWRLKQAIPEIRKELEERLRYFEAEGKLLEAQRLKERTLYDLEMLQVMGTCPGIENYARFLSGKAPGEPPYTLLDYFPKDYLVFLDESHVSVPQIRGMYNGDYMRKKTLVDYGFRLPSALDNRPLRFNEFLERISQMVFVSATPGPFELEVSSRVVEQIIRPTGLLDPLVTVKPTQGQIEDLMGAIRKRAERGERTLVTVLTVHMAEELTAYLVEHGVRARYMHHELDAFERQALLRDLRLGYFDALVGINLLREGLDLPEVSLVAILDADKQGFLRSERSLIQIIGRAARNAAGEVYLYADTVSEAMRAAIEETQRRRALQEAFNRAHGITPQTVQKSVRKLVKPEDYGAEVAQTIQDDPLILQGLLEQLEAEMWAASEALDFERAAALRDQMRSIEARLKGLPEPTAVGKVRRRRRR